MSSYDAVVLAGGRGSRLGGRDKGELTYGGRTLLDRTLSAVSGARQIVLVADVEAPAAVIVTQEDPPFGGPVAALAAGLAELSSDVSHVAVVACDMPEVAEHVSVLLRGLPDCATDEGMIAVDADGRMQYLLAVYPADALREAVKVLDDVRDRSMHSLVSGLAMREVHIDVRDVDTLADAADFGIDLDARRRAP